VRDHRVSAVKIPAAVFDTAASGPANVSLVFPEMMVGFPGKRAAVRCSMSLMPWRQASPAKTPAMSSATMRHLLPALTPTVHAALAPRAEAKVPHHTPPAPRQPRACLKAGGLALLAPAGLAIAAAGKLGPASWTAASRTTSALHAA
jgi:hypothetical protein